MTDAKQVKPLSPDEVKRDKHIPPEVIEAVNELLNARFDGTSAYFTQDTLVDMVLQKMPDLDRNDLFTFKYLDFEPIFEAVGWRVVYDSPAYCESFKANFTFTRKK